MSFCIKCLLLQLFLHPYVEQKVIRPSLQGKQYILQIPTECSHMTLNLVGEQNNKSVHLFPSNEMEAFDINTGAIKPHSKKRSILLKGNEIWIFLKIWKCQIAKYPFIALLFRFFQKKIRLFCFVPLRTKYYF